MFDSDKIDEKTRYIKNKICDAIWYIISCIIWICLYWNDPNIPSCVGGSGTCQGLFDSWPNYGGGDYFIWFWIGWG